MRRLLIPLFAALTLSLYAQQEEAEQAAPAIDIELGKTLFRNQCATCHNRDMKSDLTGPALGEAEARWSEFPREDLYEWIRNSQALIEAGHPRATELWSTWKPTIMNPNPALTDNEIESILAYISAEYNKVPAGPIAGTGGAAPTDKGADQYLYWILLVLLAVVAFVLTRIVINLRRMVAIQEGEAVPPAKSLIQTLTSKNIVGFVLFAVILFGGYTTVSNGIDFGRQQGYAPEQPIKYSHELHAGIHGIDCQYCHDGARRS